MVFRIVRQLLLLIGVASIASAEPPRDAAVMNSATPVILITGASYAADWKEPVLLPGHRTMNRGVGGQESHEVLARFTQDLAAARPDIVLIWGHINNIFRAPAGAMDAAKRRAESDYRAMVVEARKQGIKVIIATEVTMGPPTAWADRFSAFVNGLRGKENYRDLINRHVREVNAGLRRYSTQEGVQLLDFELALDGGDGFRRGEYAQEDGSHLTPAAYAELARYTASQLARVRF